MVWPAWGFSWLAFSRSDHGNGDQHRPVFIPWIWSDEATPVSSEIWQLSVPFWICVPKPMTPPGLLQYSQKWLLNSFLLDLSPPTSDFAMLHHILPEVSKFHHNVGHIRTIYIYIYIYISYYPILCPKKNPGCPHLPGLQRFFRLRACHASAMDAFSPCRIQTPQSAVHAACNEKDANSPMKVPPVDRW